MLRWALPGGIWSARVTMQLKSEVGWPELVQQVAKAYNSLPDSEKAHAAILAAQLRRDRIDRPVRPSLWPAQRHQRLRFVLAVWLWKPTSPDIDRGWLRYQPSGEFPGLHVDRTDYHAFQHSERRNHQSQVHLRVSQSAPALARVLAEFPVFRVKHFDSCFIL